MPAQLTLITCNICGMQVPYPWKKEDRYEHFLTHFEGAFSLELQEYEDTKEKEYCLKHWPPQTKRSIETMEDNGFHPDFVYCENHHDWFEKFEYSVKDRQKMQCPMCNYKGVVHLIDKNPDDGYDKDSEYDFRLR